MAIVSFKCADTEALFASGKSKRFAAIQAVAERKLAQLEAAASLEFLRAPPGNRLESLTGDRKDSTASASMRSGAFALSGPCKAPKMWKLLTITEKEQTRC